MSFSCKYYVENHPDGSCLRLRKPCRPVQPGCVLFGRVRQAKMGPPPVREPVERRGVEREAPRG